MPHWKSMIEKDYFGAWSLLDPKTGKAREVVVEIEKAQSENLKTAQTPKGKRKLVLRLKGQAKGLVINSTNAITIASMYGDNTDGWAGKKIALYVGQARNPQDGSMVPAIRVRPKVPGTNAEPMPDGPVDEAMRKQQSEAFDRQPGEDG